MNTVKVKAWGEGQGDFVTINKCDFDKDIHELYEAEETTIEEIAEAPKPKRGRRAAKSE